MKTKTMIHKVSGCTAAVSLAMLMVKYPLRRLGMHKANAVMMQAHEAASGAYFLAALAHMATAQKSSRIKTLSGLAAFAISVVLIADCHMAKEQKAKMRRHRIYSAALTLTTLSHIFQRRIFSGARTLLRIR